MKISITQHGETLTWECDNDDLGCFEVVEVLKRLMVGMGYMPDSVDDAFEQAERMTNVGES